MPPCLMNFRLDLAKSTFLGLGVIHYPATSRMVVGAQDYIT